MKLSAKVKITDIKEQNGIYLVGVSVEAEGYSFTKAYKIEPKSGEIDVKTFKENIRNDIIKEVAHRKAIEPIKSLQEKDFIIEYGESNSNKTNDNGKSQ